jgi:hypothetical protein
MVTSGAYSRKKCMKSPPIRFALAFDFESKTQLERVSKGKPSGLLGLAIRNEGKKVC